MALIPCPDCGTQLSDAAASCPKCSRPMPKKRSPILLWGLGFIGAFIGLLALVGDQSPEATAPDYCASWRRGAGDVALQRVAITENIRKLDGSKVDKACLARETDALVRWANRTCSAGSMRGDLFAMEFSREARSRCP